MHQTQSLNENRTVIALSNIATVAFLWPLALVSAVASKLDRDSEGRLGRFIRKAELDCLAARFGV